jgi:hypothetical protein
VTISYSYRGIAFSFPTFPQRARKDGAPFVCVGGRFLPPADGEMDHPEFNKRSSRPIGKVSGGGQECPPHMVLFPTLRTRKGGAPCSVCDLGLISNGRVAHPNVVLFDVRVGKSRMRSAEGDPPKRAWTGHPRE